MQIVGNYQNYKVHPNDNRLDDLKDFKADVEDDWYPKDIALSGAVDEWSGSLGDLVTIKAICCHYNLDALTNMVCVSRVASWGLNNPTSTFRI